tara:strand:- start:1609 stop:2691 length:1083 start_codon:yes stop_codon:yes gene_type:complete
MAKTNTPINLNEFEGLAKSLLDKPAYDYYSSGANDEITLLENLQAYKRIRLYPRILVDVENRDMSTTVLGTKISMPIMIAPTAFHKLACAGGELSTAKAAYNNQTIMVLSSLSTTSPEDVAASTDASLWFQLYIYKDRELTKSVIQRVEQLGYKALCITVDAPLLGRREKDVHNRFSLPDDMTIATVGDYLEKEMAESARNSSLNVYFASLLDQSVTWKDVEWIRSISNLPIILKGVHRRDDAIKAAEYGFDGIIVSNHGARQLDTVPATIDLLPAISESVGDKLEIFLDGGIRRGTDVIKAMALGAKAVLIGRPILWGLAVNGSEGASKVLQLIREETDLAMALCGISNISEITRDIIH